VTVEDWRRLIANRSIEHHFAGVEWEKPVVGDTVRVVAGENVGEVFKVVAVEGNAYRSDNRVYVDHLSGIPTWYYAWNLVIVSNRG
jgi:hypothetical protein